MSHQTEISGLSLVLIIVVHLELHLYSTRDFYVQRTHPHADISRVIIVLNQSWPFDDSQTMKNDLYAHHCFELRRRNILLEALTGRRHTRMDAVCRRSADMTSMLNDRKRKQFYRRTRRKGKSRTTNGPSLFLYSHWSPRSIQMNTSATEAPRVIDEACQNIERVSDKRQEQIFVYLERPFL